MPAANVKLNGAMSGIGAHQPLHYVMNMRFEDFGRLPTCTNQRDHETRAPDAKYLHTFDPEHLITRAAIFPDGTMYKVDGHTRVAAAEMGYAPHLLGTTLTVIVFPVRTREELEARMKVVDSAKAKKSAADEVFGAMRSLDIIGESTWCKKAGFGGGLELAVKEWVKHKGLKMPCDRKEKVQLFSDAIKLMDTWGIKPKRFNMGVLAAAFLTVKKHGGKATQFWCDFNDTYGRVDRKERDPVAMLHGYLNDQRIAKIVGGAGTNENHMRMALAYYLRAHRSPDKMFSKAAQPVTAKYFLEL